MSQLESAHRPWGAWYVLHEEDDFKVKKLLIKPGKRLSYQRHMHREEYWQIVKGTATLLLDGDYHECPENSHVYIPQEAMHRVENQTDQDLIIIEIQKGTYLGEDDIFRQEDDYGRV